MRREFMCDPEEIRLLRDRFPRIDYDQLGYSWRSLGWAMLALPSIADVLPSDVVEELPCNIRLQCLMEKPRQINEPLLAWEFYFQGPFAPPLRLAMGAVSWPWVMNAAHVQHIGLTRGERVCSICLHHHHNVPAILGEFMENAKKWIAQQGCDPYQITRSQFEELKSGRPRADAPRGR